MNITWTIEGAAEMEKALLALGPRIAGQVGMNSLRAAAKPIVAEAKRLAPRSKRKVRSRFSQNIVAKIVASQASNEISLHIGVRAPWGKLAHNLEFGHISKNQFGGPYGFVPAHPFLRPAFDTRAKQALWEMGRVLATGINARSIGKK